MPKFRKTVIGLVFGAFLLHVVLLLAIDCYYWSSLPKEADEQSGRTTRLVFHHGSVRYSSEHEFRVFKVAESSMPLTIFLAVMVAMWGFVSGDIPLRNRSTHKPG